jgi:hypothetical protein
MADHVPSQANFVGWLALVLMIFAIGAALFVLLAASMAG